MLEVATSSPRAGRRFEPVQERELHRDALAAVRDLPGANRGLVVIPEFAGPLGIPDFTAFVGDIDRIRHRNRLDVQSVVNELDAGIVSVTHLRRPSSAQAIADALGWPLQTVAGRVRSLVRRRVLLEVSTSRYVRPEALKPVGRLFAIEAKVDDWRSGLRQVRTYRVWADSYVLVMGELSERVESDLTAEVRKDNGGLVIAGRWRVRPRIGQVAARRRVQAWEMFTRAARNGLDDPPFALRVHA